jgi:hypothetical protein
VAVEASEQIRLQYLGTRNTKQVGAPELLLFALSFPVGVAASVVAERLSDYFKGHKVEHVRITVKKTTVTFHSAGERYVELNESAADVPLDVTDEAGGEALVLVVNLLEHVHLQD